MARNGLCNTGDVAWQWYFSGAIAAGLLTGALWVHCSGGLPAWGSPSAEAAAGNAVSRPATAVAWESRGACEDALRRGPRSIAGSVRIASWNIRWFPDNQLATQGSAPGTDLRWLSCAIALLRAPLLAVQEFRVHPSAVARTEELLRLLDARTGGKWQVRLDDCPRESDTRVGFLYDAARVRAADFNTFPELSGATDCRNDLHPGLSGRFVFEAFDATVISVHARWGFEQQSLEWRRSARSRLSSVVARAAESAGDADVIVLGDFNTNGARGVGAALSAAAEIGELQTAVRHGTPGMRLLPPDRRCTQHEPHGEAHLLDHALVSREMQELPPLAAAQVAGICSSRQCSAAGVTGSPYYERLSDHCPIVIELADLDLD